MIYDRIVEVFNLDTASTPLSRRLVLHSSHYYARLTVYAQRYFDAAQAGETIDGMIRVPLDGGSELRAGQYAVPADGSVYRITAARPDWDADELPVVDLSLHREEGRYELFRS